MPNTIEERVEQLPWTKIRDNLDSEGFSTIPALLSTDECSQLSKLYDAQDCFRNVVNMERYRFGSGEYKYFNYPLPPLTARLRSEFYPHLASIANLWEERLGHDISFPQNLHEFLEVCHAQGQTKPTPLLLRYETGDYNCLHQDLYGKVYFPFQVLFMLSGGQEYTGGEFLLIEQRPRAQSRGHVVRLAQGQGVIFPTQLRPVLGKRGYYRTNMRHGVSTVTSGVRVTAGIIFHDAE